MEFVGTKKSKKRKRKRRCISNRQHRDQIKLEVRSRKRQDIVVERNTFVKTEMLSDNTMEAEAFWENYKAAHEWQKRHIITWWKTRCFSLKHENYVLKKTIKNLIQNQNCCSNLADTSQCNQRNNLDNLEANEIDPDENLEFHCNEGMMEFLAQSLRHKIELKNKREFEEAAERKEKSNEEPIEGGLAWVRKRNEDAKLLYGEASSKILAMETALQTTIERHKDIVKPQYWPNIPLKL